MSKRPFHAFLDLVNLDKKIIVLKEKVNLVQQEIQDFLNQIQELDREMKDSMEHVAMLRKDVDEKELEMKRLDQIERGKKKIWDSVSNYKEFQSLKDEIESLQQKQIEQEDKVLKAWNILENEQKKIKQNQAMYDEKKDSLKKMIVEKNQYIMLLKNDITQYENQFPEKEALVPKEWLEKYTIMRSRAKDPVVTITQGGCSSCFYALTQQDLIRLRTGALLQCKGCYRLLYISDIMDKKNTE